MKQELTELVFILDKSGSMSGTESDTIGGYNSMLKKQKAMDGQCHLTTVLFDNEYELLHDRIDINGVNPISIAEYSVGGSTALLDAIGTTIHKIGSVQKHTAQAYRADKVIFVIITDGEENASREYSVKQVKELISRQKKEFNWEFIFLGANIDAVATADRIGIKADRVQNFRSDGAGVRLNYQVVSEAVSAFRLNDIIPPDWDDEIRKDYKKRSKKPKS